jgi:hypothetical protein
MQKIFSIEMWAATRFEPAFAAGYLFHAGFYFHGTALKRAD